MHLTDTILAVSSPPPSAGGLRAILRMSGPAAWRLAREIVDLSPSAAAGHHAPLAVPLLSAHLKIASALLFKAPRSFTGEDVAELHLPNSPALLAECMQQLLKAGGDELRLAGPGEFSARAFFNGKIDLTEAEGIAATINAASEIELRAAGLLREGMLHKEINHISRNVADVLALVESSIDFADEEDISFISAAKLQSTLDQLAGSLEQLLITCLRIDRLDTPPTVAFVGRPNVGKSSLINALAQTERSIVSPIAGTTRDILTATLHSPAGSIRLLDVPGEEIPSDELRSKMMEARRLAMLEADLVIFVIDTEFDESVANTWQDIPGEHLAVWNKVDLLAQLPDDANRWTTTGTGGAIPVPVSARTGHNIARLREKISRLAGQKETLGHGRFALNQRHRLILQDAKAALWHAANYAQDEKMLRRHVELLAADLRRSLDLLGQITGAISPDEILGRIFSQFCIGK